ncbi:DUF2141 domain-containing protein [Croceicoccus ponticola]|uniref:DUF2141 domain-containing protein n=1 Tax=Croceicoccus ponticola TaxID=2217664 RepID=A0A437GY81_9SPHN|nr:DUF2141 domain-containing protein [Croceicoccus ponticola]RVQ67637.1 DUF2141 domain-containing protein [Croceicoccus ponticola]
MIFSTRILLPLAAVPLLGATPPVGADVTVMVSNMRSANGLVSACLAHEKAAFPDCSGPGGLDMTVPAGKAKAFTFRNVVPGRYAIALLHDENSNGKIDKALMIPREGFGFSRDAPVRMGPPPFSAAAFEVGEDDISQPIKMRYIL